MKDNQSSTTIPRIPELDGLRGLAILSVLVWHYAVCQVVTQPHTPLAYVMAALGFTWSGVDLFFVLSGFLIGGILLDNKRTGSYFKTFYVRRICRIFPVYFLMLTLFVLINGVWSLYIADYHHHMRWLFRTPIPLWSYMTFTQNIEMAYVGTFGANWLGITWSLAVEEQFYIMLPLIIYFLSEKSLLVVLGLLVLAAPVIRLASFYDARNPFYSTYVLMPCRADALLLGVLCACLVRHDAAKCYVIAHQKGLYGLLALVSLGVAILQFHGWTIGTMAMSAYGYTLLAITYSCCLLIAVTETSGPVTIITRNRALRWLGTIAYGVYMFHQPVSGLMHAAFRHQTPQITQGLDAAVTLGALVVTLLISAISWKVWEKPIIAWGRAFGNQKQSA